MSDEEKKDEAPRAEWTRKDQFHIVGELRKVVDLAKQASEKEVALLRRKLEKMTYGS